MQNSVPEISVIGCGVCTLSQMSKTRTLLSGSMPNEPNKPTQLAKRTLIKVSGARQCCSQLLTVISKMQSVLEFNDVRSVSVIRLDRRYDTQASRMRRAPSPSYAGSAPDSDVDQKGVLTQLLLTFQLAPLARCPIVKTKTVAGFRASRVSIER